MSLSVETNSNIRGSCGKSTGGQRLNPAFVSDIEKKVLSRTVEMETDQTFNEGGLL